MEWESDGTANEIKILGSRCGPTNGKENMEKEGKIEVMADQEFEGYEKGNIDIGRFEGKCIKIWKIL